MIVQPKLCRICVIAISLYALAACSTEPEDTTPPGAGDTPVIEQPGDENPLPGNPLPDDPQPGTDPEPDVDTDGDGVADSSDAFPNDPDETVDTDRDGVGDNSDAFPNNPEEWLDSDGDGVGDNSDIAPNDPDVPGQEIDSDGDGVPDIADAYPNDPVRTTQLPPEFDVGVTYSRELYVSTTGNDNTGDGSINFPYNSVETAARNATPGTRINLLPGTYPADGFIENLHGNENEPIAIVANGNVVFDADGASTVLRFRDPRYIVLEGFTVENTSSHGINIDDGSSYSTPAEYVIVRNLTFRNIGSGNNNDCLKMSGVDRFLVLDSEFENCDQGEAIDMVGCHEGLIKGNFFHNIPRNAINTKGGSAEILIQGNRFSDIASRAINAGGSTGLQYFRPDDANYEGAKIRMLANVFERVGPSGGASVAFVGCDLCVFANNTIIEPQTYIARILQESQDSRFVPSRDGFFINNIIVFNTSDLNSYVNIGEATAPETFTFGNNLWYALDNPGFNGPNIPGVIPAETGSIIQQDPLIDITNAIYTIPLSSPAAGNGRSVPGSIEGDFNGVPYTMPIDIGAFKAQ